MENKSQTAASGMGPPTCSLHGHQPGFQLWLLNAYRNVAVGPWQIATGEIVCDQSLHGLLNSFRRAA